MELLKGLKAYEIFLMAGGIILFIVLTVLLVILVLRGKKVASLPGLYLIPVIMIGFSAIKKIEYKDGSIIVELMTDAVKCNPSDQGLKGRLISRINALEPRASRDAETLYKIAGAREALGDNAMARSALQKAIKVKPDMEKAREMMRRIGD